MGCTLLFACESEHNGRIQIIKKYSRYVNLISSNVYLIKTKFIVSFKMSSKLNWKRITSVYKNTC